MYEYHSGEAFALGGHEIYNQIFGSTVLLSKI